MTQKQIEQVAKRYVKEQITFYKSDDHWIKFYESFIAGAESRQAEIDGLKISIAMAQDMISELRNHSK